MTARPFARLSNPENRLAIKASATPMKALISILQDRDTFVKEIAPPCRLAKVQAPEFFRSTRALFR
jgi:hypothetical protein